MQERIIHGTRIDDQEFHEREKWIDEQKRYHDGETICYAMIDGKWEVIAHGHGDDAVFISLEEYAKKHDMKNMTIFFR